MAINGNLPHDIRVTEVTDVAEDFHARFSAKGKHYCYRIFTGRVLNPLLFRYIHQTTYSLDLDLIRNAAQMFIGEHDFRSFTVTPEKEIDTRRSVTELDVWFDEEEEIISFDISANGFLRYMVRAIVGTLVDIGRGHLPADSIPEIFAANNRAAAGTSLPAKGLALIDVSY
jgi:tRNA pseudouridine38-40 synthase